MRESLLEFLCCLKCQSDLNLKSTEFFADDSSDTLTGSLVCANCASVFPIVNGVPRLLPEVLEVGVAETAKNFGDEWNRFNVRTDAHRDQLRNWLKPLPQGFLKDKVIVDFGCGMGRNPLYFSEEGAKVVVGIDVSHAVDMAYRNCRHRGNVHIVQADIYHPPLRPKFSFVFSLGVLHHLPDPKKGFENLVRMAIPGATIFVWVYGRENNGWLVHVVSPLREKITSKLSSKFLLPISYFFTLLFFFLMVCVYLPMRRVSPRIFEKMFYSEYFYYNSSYNFGELHLIVYDHLTAPIAHYLSRDQVEEWFTSISLKIEKVVWHNQNSWTFVGRR